MLRFKFYFEPIELLGPQTMSSPRSVFLSYHGTAFCHEEGHVAPSLRPLSLQVGQNRSQNAIVSVFINSSFIEQGPDVCRGYPTEASCPRMDDRAILPLSQAALRFPPALEH